MEKLIEKLKNIPKSPGVYLFLDKNARVIYVGKAKNLKSRVSQYFQKHDNRPQLPYLMAEAADINYTVVSNELESAFLENTLIKQYTPKYNIDLKDDKNYAFITIDYSFEIPQIAYSRKIADQPRRHSEADQGILSPAEESQTKIKRSFARKNKSDNGLRMTPRVKYFGPYSAAYKIRETLNLVRKIFPFCAAQKVSGRPCFYYYMHRCPGVCIGKITLDEYSRQLDKIIKFLQGDITSAVKEIKAEMVLASASKKFETAARLRDQLRALEILQEKQNVILPKKVDWDIVSLATSDGYACVNLFKIREGKLFDKENFVYELPAGDGNEAGVLQRFLEQYYLETSSQPRCIYLQAKALNGELVGQILRSRFLRRTEITVPKKGKLKSLVNLGKLNAEEYLRNWLNDKAGNLDKINKALEHLKQVLLLEKVPKRIECYDISNIQGTNAVGSMVVFKDGLPAKSEYRKFKIKSKATPDDFAMMKEMLARRLSRLPNGENNQEPSNKNQSWDKPDLIIIDGGKGQLSAAQEVIGNIPMIGLAKRVEEIFLPENPEPIILSHDEPALQLLQRLRDEAHRFGITFHRKLRSKQAIKSALDEIPGIGPKTKKLLKQKFGTVSRIKQSSLEELSEVVGLKLAQTIKEKL